MSSSRYGFVRSEESYLVDESEKCEVDDVIERMVKFDRAEVAAILPLGEEVDIVITGRLNDGTLFEGTDFIRVIEEGMCCADFNGDGKVTGRDLSILKGEYARLDCHPVKSPCLADANGDRKVTGADLSLLKKEYGKADCPVPIE